MVLQPNDLIVDTNTRGPIPLRIEPDKHGGAQARKFAEVASATTLAIGTPVAWNDTLKAFVSWDPNTGGAAVNEVQEINMDADCDGGTFTLQFKGEVTAAIAYNAAAATIETAFEGLSTVGAGNGTVAGGTMPGTPVTITFTGDLAGAPQELVEIDPSALSDGGVFDVGAEITRTTVGSGGPVNAVQTMSDSGTASGGTFTLEYDGQTTDAIDYDATAGTIEAALDALSNVVTGAISVSGGTLPGTPVVFTFDGASVAGSDQPLIYADSTNLTGTDPDYNVVMTTQGTDGNSAPADEIRGFVYPSEIVLSTAGEVMGVIMMKGSIHRDDVALPTAGSPTQAQLDAALRDGPMARGLLVTGIDSVR